MLAKKLADPTYRAGAKPSIEGVPARLEQLQALYDAGEFEIIPKFKQRGPDKGKPCGYAIKGRGYLNSLRTVLNDCVKGEKPIKNTLTISRWLEAGCPGMVLRDEDKLTGEDD